MYHIVYLTTNLVNNKFYVGVHSTHRLDDGYLGTGKTILRAIKKYGKDNFKRSILHYCLTEEDSLLWEKSIVTQEFINRSDTYNIKLGGGNKVKHTFQIKEKIREKAYGRLVSQSTKDKLSSMRKGRSLSTNHIEGIRNSLTGKKKSESHINNLKISQRNRTTDSRFKKSYTCISPDGEVFKLHGTISEFCKYHNFDYSHVRSYFNKGKIVKCRNQKYFGWEFIKHS